MKNLKRQPLILNFYVRALGFLLGVFCFQLLIATAVTASSLSGADFWPKNCLFGKSSVCFISTGSRAFKIGESPSSGMAEASSKPTSESTNESTAEKSGYMILGPESELVRKNDGTFRLFKGQVFLKLNSKLPYAEFGLTHEVSGRVVIEKEEDQISIYQLSQTSSIHTGKERSVLPSGLHVKWRLGSKVAGSPQPFDSSAKLLEWTKAGLMTVKEMGAWLKVSKSEWAKNQSAWSKSLARGLASIDKTVIEKRRQAEEEQRQAQELEQKMRALFRKRFFNPAEVESE